DVNAKSKTGETALDWAKKFGSKEVIAALGARGANEGVPYAKPQIKPAGLHSAGQAAEKATALLQKTSTEFFTQSGCVGCHHQPAALMAAGAARSAGLKVDEGAAQGHVKMSEGQANALLQAVVERLDVGGAMDGWVYELLGMSSAGYAAN